MSVGLRRALGDVHPAAPLRLVIPLVILVAGVGLGLAEFLQERATAEAGIRRDALQRMTLSVTRLQSSQSHHLADGDLDRLRAETATLGAETAVVRGFTALTNGRVLASIHQIDIGRQARSLLGGDDARATRAREAQIREALRTHHAVVAIIDGGREVVGVAPLTVGFTDVPSGFLYLEHGLDEARKSAATAVLHDTYRFWAFVAFSVLGLWAVFELLVARRLARLSHVADELAEGRRVPAAVRGRDEVGHLGVAIEKMATELERRSRELERSERRLRALVEQIPVVVYRAAATEDVWHYVSPQIEALTGYAAEDWLMLPTPWLRGLHPDDRDRVLAVERDGLRSGTFSVEYRLARRDESYVWVRDEAVLIDTENTSFWQGILIDIDEQRRLERQLREAQKMEALGQLAGGVAHDFNNLLAVISGYGDLALATLTPSSSLSADGTDVREHIEEICRAAARATALSGQLLTFSRRDVRRPQRLEITELFTDLRPMLQQLVGSSVELELEVPEAPTTIIGDRTQIERVAFNLAVNARDAMPDGGVFTVGLRQTAAAGVREAMITFADTGVGIDETALDRIFEPFFTTKEVGHGTGLGLSIVHGIVQDSGGRVEVRSGAHGTVFCVYLPLATTDVPSDPEQPEATPAPERLAITALVVEDDAAVLALTTRMLERSGATVIAAGAPSEALRLTGDTLDGIDVVVSDVLMPELSGIELVAELRRRVSGIAVVFMSGFTSDLDPAPDEVFLAKPFNQLQLRAAVDLAVKRNAPRGADPGQHPSLRREQDLVT